MSATATASLTKNSAGYHLEGDGRDGADPFSFETPSQDGASSDATEGVSSFGASTFPTLAFNWRASSVWDSRYSTAGAESSVGTGSSGSPAPATTGAGPGGGSTTVTSSGSGLVFVNTYDASCTPQFEACIVAAEKQLEGLFSNTVTLNVTFQESTASGGGDVLKNNWSSWDVVTYAQLKAALPSADQALLPTTDPTGGLGFHLPEAYARMLGLSTSAPATDDTVTLFDPSSWDYGQDVINGVTHELTEGAMGRVGGLGDQNGVWSAMDLFRVTSSGTPDYTDGRDGATTYFASNSSDISSKAVPALSFNNEYNSSGTKVNTGDTADWTQTAVFGSTGFGETLTLNQTELNVMQALGWDLTLNQDVFNVASGNWETATNWSAGSMPITVQDVLISGIFSTAAATLNSNVTINSISTGPLGSLTISGDSSLTATTGTVLNPSDHTTFLSGNYGTIDVDVGSTLKIGNTFDNIGTLAIGVILSSSGGNGSLNLDGGTVTLTDTATPIGTPTLNLGQVSSSFQAQSTGSITNGSLINVNNDIVGGGSIHLTSFDNQLAGTVDANQEEGNSLSISAATFTNEGTMTADTRATLDLGADGATESLANTGSVKINGDGDLAISGNFTITGSGGVYMKGAGAEITSDGVAADTLINESNISDDSSGQIGDASVFGATNDLTFENLGATGVSGAGDTLTLATGSNTIADGGGTLEAETDGHLVIDSNVTTGVIRANLTSFPTAGTIEATSGGVVTDAAAITDGVSPPFLSVAGQVIISGGIFELLASGSVSIPIEFTGSSPGILELHGTSAPAGAISGLAVGDVFEFAGSSISAYSIGTSSLTITTSAAAYDFASIGYSGTITGFIAWADASTGLEKITFTDGAATAVNQSGGTIYLANAPANVTGGSDNVYFVGAAAETLDLSSTAGNWDTVSGANGTITLTSAQASVFGGGDTIEFAGTGDAASLYGTTPSWDVVSGAGGAVYLTSAQASVIGSGDTVDFASGSGNAASLYNTASGWDSVIGSGGTIYLTGAQTNVSGGFDTIDFVGGSGNATSLYNTNGDWDSVVGSGGTAYLTNAQSNISGGGDTVVFAGGSGNAASLYNTDNDWDSVTGSSGLVYLTSSQANIAGGLDTIDFASGAGNAISIYSTAGIWDTVNGSSGTVYLTSSQASVIGGADTIDLAGAGTVASLASTGATGDTVNGSNVTLYLYNSIAKVTGSNDTLNLNQSDTANLIGGSDILAFQAGIGGVDVIKGWASSDVIHMSHTDFASFGALSSSGDLKQSGLNTIIALNGSDLITLQGVTASTLTAANFNFV